MNPEKRLLVIGKYLAVKLDIFLLCAFIRVLCPQRMCVVKGHGTLLNLKLWNLFLNRLFSVLTGNLSLLLECFNNYVIFSFIFGVDGLKLFRCIGFLKIYLIRHERAVFLDNLSCLILVAELKAVLIDVQCNLSTDSSPVTVCHRKLSTAVTFPMYRHCPFLVRKRVNMNLIGYHKC